jgi:hypothetical protein
MNPGNRISLFVVDEVAGVGVSFEEVLPGINEKAARPGGRVTDVFSRLGIAHLHHHADDMA